MKTRLERSLALGDEKNTTTAGALRGCQTLGDMSVVGGGFLLRRECARAAGAVVNRHERDMGANRRWHTSVLFVVTVTRGVGVAIRGNVMDGPTTRAGVLREPALGEPGAFGVRRP